jgi:hypothetical protein
MQKIEHRRAPELILYHYGNRRMIPVGLVYAKHSWHSQPASPQPARRPGPVLSTPRSLQQIKR